MISTGACSAYNRARQRVFTSPKNLSSLSSLCLLQTWLVRSSKIGSGMQQEKKLAGIQLAMHVCLPALVIKECIVLPYPVKWSRVHFIVYQRFTHSTLPRFAGRGGVHGPFFFCFAPTVRSSKNVVINIRMSMFRSPVFIEKLLKRHDFSACRHCEN